MISHVVAEIQHVSFRGKYVAAISTHLMEQPHLLLKPIHKPINSSSLKGEYDISYGLRNMTGLISTQKNGENGGANDSRNSYT